MASGKGGTGKTTVAVNLALSVDDAHLFDCDVEEPNAHTLLHPKEPVTTEVTVPAPRVNMGECTLCGKCVDFCQFNAIFVGKTKVMIYDEICHSCGGCMLACPQKAITEVERAIGSIVSGSTDEVKLTYGSLNVGEPLAVPVIKAVKAQANDNESVIFDAPPGTSCTLIETVKECDYVILVTEPTPFGLHYLSMTLEVIAELGTPHGVIINRDGIGDQETVGFLEQKGIPILMRIPFSKEIAELYSRGIPFVQEMPRYRKEFQETWKRIKREVTNGQ